MYVKDAPADFTKDDAHTASATTKSTAQKSDPSSGVFGFLLAGMAGMFLLFLASNAMTDLHRELRQRTLARYHTLHLQLTPFVAGKIVFAVVVLLLCSLILLGGGGLIFRVDWRQPLSLSLLALGYAGFAAGLMAVLVALIPDERKAGALNTVVGMGLGLAGGCMFPPQSLPAFLREHITPLLPTHWFVDTARNLQYSGGEVAWILPLVNLLVVGVFFMALAGFLFRRQFRAGVRA
jgi:ABC-2 type transport system permease protein